MNKIKKTVEKMGFTLAELMVVIALMAVLGTLIAGAVNLALSATKSTVHRANGKLIEGALSTLYSRTRAYCSTVDPLPDGTPTCSAGSTAAELVTVSGTGTAATYKFANADNNDVLMSFKTVAEGLGLQLSGAPECDAGAAGSFAAGGGVMYLDPARYYIMPASVTCNSPLPPLKANGTALDGTAFDAANDSKNF